MLSIVFNPIKRGIMGIFGSFIALGAIVLLYATMTHTPPGPLFSEYLSHFTMVVTYLIKGIIVVAKAIVLAISTSV